MKPVWNSRDTRRSVRRRHCPGRWCRGCAACRGRSCRGLKSGPSTSCVLAREAEGRVPHRAVVERPGLAGRDLVDLRDAAVAAADRIGDQEVRPVVDHRVQVAELAPDLVRRRAVEVHLDVVVVAIGRACLPDGSSCCVKPPAPMPGDVGRRVEAQQLHRDRVDAVGRNLVVRKRRAARAVGVARRAGRR